jgi:hypothetical protein
LQTWDFGLELAECFVRHNLITSAELAALQDPSAWMVQEEVPDPWKVPRLLAESILRLLPKPLRQFFKEVTTAAWSKENLLKSLFKKETDQERF